MSKNEQIANAINLLLDDAMGNEEDTLEITRMAETLSYKGYIQLYTNPVTGVGVYRVEAK